MSVIMTTLKKNIPNLLTMLNLLAGCAAILLSFYDLVLASLLIFLAGVFDFSDGLAARLLDAWSEFGKELDSLADIVSFGVAPSFILYHLLRTSIMVSGQPSGTGFITTPEMLLLATSFLPAVFTAIRLARFNTTAGREKVFSGLPSPASGIFIASLGYILHTADPVTVRHIMLNPGFLLTVNALLCILMVLPLPMFTIKFSGFSLAKNRLRYLFVMPSLALLACMGLKSIPLIILWYILLSLIGEVIVRVKSR